MDTNTSEAARALGRITSERKAAAARENGKKGGGKGARPFAPLASIPCTCGRETHGQRCPRGRATKRRLDKGVPLD